MNTNFDKYRKVVHAAIWFGDKILLAKILKESYHKGFWTDPGGKVDTNELIQDALTREVQEETDLFIPYFEYNLIDCFVYPKREIKSFLYEIHLGYYRFSDVVNIEPNKQSDWKLFTIDEALKLKLLPSVEIYLKQLKK